MALPINPPFVWPGHSPAQDLMWIAAGVLAFFAIRYVSPKTAGIILATFVIGALVKIGPQLGLKG